MLDASQADRELRRLAEGREILLGSILAAEKKGKVSGLPYQNYLVKQVLQELAGDIRRDVKGASQKGAGAYKKFVRYLGSIDANIAALRAIQAVLAVLMKSGGADVPQPMWKQAAQAAGNAVYHEYLMRHFKDVSPALFRTLQREYSRGMTADERHLIGAFKAKFAAEKIAFPTWDFGDIEGVGTYLLQRMLAHNFIESWSRTEHKKGRAYTVRYLQLDQGLRGATLEITDMVAEIVKVSGPMIEAPLDWDAETNSGGGFHTSEMQKTSPFAVQGKGVQRVAPNVVNMLNTLQQRQWQINVPVLQAVQAVSLRRDFGDIVSPIQTAKPDYDDTFNEEQKKAWKGLARAWYTEKKVRAVKHMGAQRAFREARDLMQYPALWFAYYADFRGRGYARSATVSPQGTDLEKGLLRYLAGKPLSTPASVRHFKRHGANKYGLDKLPMAAREAWVDEHHDSLVGIGRNPLDNLGWTEAESPVQFLAWAIEYAAWVDSPSTFVSRLPMSQDGTCNGLQNYSGLMCDAVGGAAVNLTPGDAPRDIYADVAVRVTELVEGKPPSPLREVWKAVELNRKWTKRTTMTLPYGCTRYGCSVFINDEIESQKPAAIPMADYGDAANYLSYVVWDALDDIVVKAREVMEWLRGWAKHAVSTDQRVAWVAPSGLYVVSEYERMGVTRIKSVAFKSHIQLYKPTGRQDVAKVMNAVAPNFVHSLDASHLARVVAKATAEGMSVTAIHDDFGVHAEDTERFHEIIREEFVEMYEGNTILEAMAVATGYDVPPPAKGDLNLRDVLKSTYFFG